MFPRLCHERKLKCTDIFEVLNQIIDNFHPEARIFLVDLLEYFPCRSNYKDIFVNMTLSLAYEVF